MCLCERESMVLSLRKIRPKKELQTRTMFSMILWTAQITKVVLVKRSMVRNKICFWINQESLVRGRALEKLGFGNIQKGEFKYEDRGGLGILTIRS